MKCRPLVRCKSSTHSMHKTGNFMKKCHYNRFGGKRIYKDPCRVTVMGLCKSGTLSRTCIVHILLSRRHMYL